LPIQPSERDQQRPRRRTGVEWIGRDAQVFHQLRFGVGEREMLQVREQEQLTLSGMASALPRCPSPQRRALLIEFDLRCRLIILDSYCGNALAMPDNVRLFLLSNLQHFALANAKSELVKTCAFPTNPLNAGPPARALLVALDGWIGTVHSAGQPIPQPRATGRWCRRPSKTSAFHTFQASLIPPAWPGPS